MRLINRAQLSFIRSLQKKKNRKEELCFLVEGKKGVGELLTSNFKVSWITCTDAYWRAHETQFSTIEDKVSIATEEQLACIGSLQSNDSIIAVAQQQPNQLPDLHKNEFVLALDDIRDPGNLGTIIRTADWFGIQKIIASTQTVEFYNPKVIRATMGSFSRVQFAYTTLIDYFAKTSWPIYGACLDGEPISKMSFGEKGILVIGNESRGISTSIAQCIQRRISIPKVGEADSLNASVATGIILYNLMRGNK